MQTDWFDASYWSKKGSLIGESKGRHITWFIKSPEDNDERTWVLRHYYRGGLVSKLTADKFVFTSLQQTRGFREVTLLLDMIEMDLPVPTVIGARVIRKGLFYNADLLMEKIDAKDLVALLSDTGLSNTKLSQTHWNNIGKTIANFHRKGIYHADLNAHNILIDASDKVWLIDFDRCEKRKIKISWQQQNLQRLKRSFIKEKSLLTRFNFEDENWKELMDGYRSAM